MKNKIEEQKEYFERSAGLSVFLLVTGILISWLSYDMLANTNPWGTLVAIPGIVIVMHAGWWLMNPYAMVFDDRVQIRQSLFYDKDFYFIDMNDLKTTTTNKWHFVYNDHESQAFPLFGMRPSEKERFKLRLLEKINESLQNRLSENAK